MKVLFVHTRPRMRSLLLPSALLLVTGVVLGAGFKVLRADAEFASGVLSLDAEIDFELSQAALDALHNSVPLTLELRIQVLAQRQWLWDEVIAEVDQRLQLKYHPLAQQYVVTNLNSGTLNSFPTRRAALRFIGRLRDFPVLDRGLLPEATAGYGRLRAELDIESLPAPLRPVAYFSKSWRLASNWYPFRLPL